VAWAKLSSRVLFSLPNAATADPEKTRVRSDRLNTLIERSDKAGFSRRRRQDGDRSDGVIDVSGVQDIDAGVGKGSDLPRTAFTAPGPTVVA